MTHLKKRCLKCKRLKSTRLFYRAVIGRLGHGSYCKACMKRRRQWVANPSELDLSRMATHYGYRPTEPDLGHEFPDTKAS